MNESKLGSLRTLLRVIEDLHDPEHVIFYRGHGDKVYGLTPSIYRKDEWINNEHKMIQELLIRCPKDFDGKQSSFEKLVKMQHYDLPTRLLDITENPLVALYFACSSKMDSDKDGELIFFKIPKKDIKYFDSDTVSVVSNIAWLKSNFSLPNRFSADSKSFHNEKNEHADVLMHCIRQEKPHFRERVNPKHIQSVVCVKPKLDNQRIIRQDGAFLLFGIEEEKRVSASINPEWVLQPSGNRYIIKAKDKPEINKQLVSLGISKAKLFPEIDMVSQFIKDDLGLQIENYSDESSLILSKPKLSDWL
ncbi:FRG domain-containing protein [Vibrio diazotrophicus]|uniref:FRG domain-containing protein n=1 Tax=Vibrio diazotrophicus TaxID=685 RepID=A0ABX4W420_VIBDI|nr:FRG domain-containing protein [Vibrio diazotrophicus]PNH95345.1 FRG domain-containing protein [Vibrio diazotrophicus]PNH96304.1 FRG domain-containing protein [Vibrio diazotrophicus]